MFLQYLGALITAFFFLLPSLTIASPTPRVQVFSRDEDPEIYHELTKRARTNHPPTSPMPNHPETVLQLWTRTHRGNEVPQGSAWGWDIDHKRENLFKTVEYYGCTVVVAANQYNVVIAHFQEGTRSVAGKECLSLDDETKVDQIIGEMGEAWLDFKRLSTRANIAFIIHSHREKTTSYGYKQIQEFLHSESVEKIEPYQYTPAVPVDMRSKEDNPHNMRFPGQNTGKVVVQFVPDPPNGNGKSTHSKGNGNGEGKKKEGVPGSSGGAGVAKRSPVGDDGDDEAADGAGDPQQRGKFRDAMKKGSKKITAPFRSKKDKKGGGKEPSQQPPGGGPPGGGDDGGDDGKKKEDAPSSKKSEASSKKLAEGGTVKIWIGKRDNDGPVWQHHYAPIFTPAQQSLASGHNGNGRNGNGRNGRNGNGHNGGELPAIGEAGEGSGTAGGE